MKNITHYLDTLMLIHYQSSFYVKKDKMKNKNPTKIPQITLIGFFLLSIMSLPKSTPWRNWHSRTIMSQANS